MSFTRNIYTFGGDYNPLITTDLADKLQGWNITCDNFDETNWFNYIGISTISIIIIMYVLRYHGIGDTPRNNNCKTWWLYSLILLGITFLIGYFISIHAITSYKNCEDLVLEKVDCFGVGTTNAILSLIIYMFITTLPFPRSKSTNWNQVTFFKP